MIKGNDIIIKAYSPSDASTLIPLAAAKSCNITYECNVIEVSSPISGKARTFIPGRTDWGIELNSLILNFSGDVLKVGEEVVLQIGKVIDGTRTLSNDKLSGRAICTKYNATAQRGSLAKGQFTFQGTGPLQ